MSFFNKVNNNMIVNIFKYHKSFKDLVTAKYFNKYFADQWHSVHLCSICLTVSGSLYGPQIGWLFSRK